MLIAYYSFEKIEKPKQVLDMAKLEESSTKTIKEIEKQHPELMKRLIN